MKAVVKQKIFKSLDSGKTETDFLYVSELGKAKDYYNDIPETDEGIIACGHTESIKSAFIFDLKNPSHQKIIKDLSEDITYPTSSPEEWEMWTLGTEVILLDFEPTLKKQIKRLETKK